MEGYLKAYWWVVDDHNLNATEKWLYLIITALSEKDGYCTASDGYFSQKLTLSPRRTREYMLALEQKGYIIRESHNSKRKIYPVEKEYIHARG